MKRGGVKGRGFKAVGVAFGAWYAGQMGAGLTAVRGGVCCEMESEGSGGRATRGLGVGKRVEPPWAGAAGGGEAVKAVVKGRIWSSGGRRGSWRRWGGDGGSARVGVATGGGGVASWPHHQVLRSHHIVKLWVHRTRKGRSRK